MSKIVHGGGVSKSEEGKAFLFYLPGTEAPQSPHAALKKSFLKGRLAKTMVARDDKCQAAWKVPIRPARSPKAAATNLTGYSKFFALPSPCGLTRPMDYCLFRREILSELAILRWTLPVVLWWSPARNASGFILANLCGKLHCCAVRAFPTMDPGR